MVINAWVAAIKTLSSRRENRIPDQDSISARTAAHRLSLIYGVRARSHGVGS